MNAQLLFVNLQNLLVTSIFVQLSFKPNKVSLADPRGARKRSPLGPISFIFMQFSAKILSNNRFSPQTQGGWCPPCPCLGNPGSVTGYICKPISLAQCDKVNLIVYIL